MVYHNPITLTNWIPWPNYSNQSDSLIQLLGLNEWKRSGDKFFTEETESQKRKPNRHTEIAARTQTKTKTEKTSSIRIIEIFVKRRFINTRRRTHRLQMSTSGPYVFPTMNSSGAAYSGDPQCVFKGSSSLKILLSPKSTEGRRAGPWAQNTTRITHVL